ncbi:MAG: hypothetical protein ACWGO1_04015 [Anaerolineales bacterium]
MMISQARRSISLPRSRIRLNRWVLGFAAITLLITSLPLDDWKITPRHGDYAVYEKSY